MLQNWFLYQPIWLMYTPSQPHTAGLTFIISGPAELSSLNWYQFWQPSCILSPLVIMSVYAVASLFSHWLAFIGCDGEFTFMHVICWACGGISKSSLSEKELIFLHQNDIFSPLSSCDQGPMSHFMLLCERRRKLFKVYNLQSFWDTCLWRCIGLC